MSKTNLMDMYLDAVVTCSLYAKAYENYVKELNDKNAECFIKNYLKSRAKAGVFNITFTEPDLLFKKSVHTVSAFLLGISLKSIIPCAFSKKLKETTGLEGDLFEYAWMLCCLEHDLLSAYEENADQITSLQEFFGVAEINYTIYERNLPDGIELPAFVPTYQKDTVQKYFSYRIRNNVVDHGIAGGYLIFDRLVKNYLTARENNGGVDEFNTEQDGHTLLWNKTQICVFEYAADAIITHNIWHKGKEEGLPDEITQEAENEKKLKREENPLAFFCALIDTIEPVKRFSKLSAWEVLKNVSIEIVGSEDMNGIRIAWSDEIKQQPEFWTWMGNISSMKDWMQVNVSPCRREGEWCSVTIDFRKIRCVAGGMRSPLSAAQEK